ESTTKRTVELSSIFSSSDQQGLKEIKANPTDPWATALRELFQNWSDTGASNVFLVRGSDITAAPKACRMVLATSRSAELAWGPDDRKHTRKSGSLLTSAYFEPTASFIRWSNSEITSASLIPHTRPTGGPL